MEHIENKIKFSQKNKNGQILFMFVFAVLVIFAFLTLIMNISKLSSAKIKLQKAADAAALAMATYQARCFNAVADKNFILKYPSGDKNKIYDKTNKSSYSFPGVDQISVYDGYEFISESEYENYLRVITPHQDQQDRFIRIYEKMIPKLAEDYAGKNDKDATVYDYSLPNFKFTREKVKIKYRDWRKSIGGKYELRDELETAMNHTNNYSYSMVRLNKTINIWKNEFKLQAVALAEVVKDKAQLWPEPKPEYKAKLAPTQEEGVIH